MQCVPHLAKACEELYVFQRTPSSVDVRDNRPTDPEWFAEIATPGWQQRWLENFTANQTGGMPKRTWCMDGWTDLARRIREKIMALPPEDFTPEKMMAAFEDSDFEKMERDPRPRRLDRAGPGDRAEAQGLVPPAVQAAVLPRRVPAGLQRARAPTSSTPTARASSGSPRRGVVAGGVEYEVDCIIYASGFEVGTEFTRRAGYDMTGRDGVTLSEYWADGMRTKHGMHVHGFPNVFIVQPTQGANLISNVPHNLTEAGQTIATIVKHALDARLRRGRGHQGGRGRLDGAAALRPEVCMLGSPDCTPGYYNNEGQDHRGRDAVDRRLPAGRDGLLPVPRRLAHLGSVRGPRLSLNLRAAPGRADPAPSIDFDGPSAPGRGRSCDRRTVDQSDRPRRP